MSQETVILFANEAFYLTFASGDAEVMDSIWSSRENVTCIHPGWHPLIGRDKVMSSWRAILSNSEAPEIRCEHNSVHIDGSIAYVLCAEILATGQLAATNIFALEGSAWKMIHHQAGPMPTITLEPGKNMPTVQ